MPTSKISLYEILEAVKSMLYTNTNQVDISSLHCADVPIY